MSPSSPDLDPTADLHAFAVPPFVFLLVGASMVVLSLWMLRSRRRVRATSHPARARVIAVREEAVHRAGQILPTRLYFPTVAFVLPDGRGVETEAASGTSLASRVGDEVAVCYDPEHPGRVHLEGTLRVTGAIAGVMLALGLITVVLGALGLAVVRALGI